MPEIISSEEKILTRSFLDLWSESCRREAGLRALDPSTDRKAFAKLLAEAENGKIQLSNSPSAYISIADLGKGLEDFEASFELTHLNTRASSSHSFGRPLRSANSCWRRIIFPKQRLAGSFLLVVRL